MKPEARQLPAPPRLGRRTTLQLRHAIRWLLPFAATLSVLAADEPAPVRNGAYESAAQSLATKLEKINPRKNPAEYADCAVQLAGCYQALGHSRKADKLLRQTDARLPSGSLRERTAILNALGELCLGDGRLQESAIFLEAAEDLGTTSRDKPGLGRVLVNVGNLQAARGRHQEALAAWRESLELLQGQPDLDLLTARVLVNALRSAARHTNLGAIQENTLRDCLARLEALPDNSAKANLLISFAVLLRTIPAPGPQPTLPTDTLNRLQYRALTAARTAAETAKDAKLISLSDGHLGHMYEDAGRNEEALALTRQAILELQRVNAPESLYLWQWQLGRLFESLDRIDEAITLYEDAMQTLTPIRQEFYRPFGGSINLFEEQVKPVYGGLVKLLLKKAATTKDDTRKAGLRKARDVFEALKTVELEDLFQDECVTAFTAGKTRLDSIPQGAAVLSPIPYPDRLILLLSINDNIHQFTLPLDGAELGRTVRQLRQHLQTPGDELYRPYATTLYNQIIRPVEDTLNQAGIHTLVIAPYGSLCLVPFAALLNNKQFLSERFAVVNVPGMSLTNMDPTSKDARAVLTGLSLARHGFTPLPGVPGELNAVSAIMGADVLSDETFTVRRIDQLLRENNYTIVHMATHGEFAGEPRDSFLVTYDGKLNMCDLGAMLGQAAGRGKPIELLSLSACQTAAGDERSAFGFGGLCVRAGVKSALATLWSVNDDAAREGMTQFYDQLKNTTLNKAQALQSTQKRMMQDPRFNHPAHWAAFVLLGNWM